jgi:hypothetical protein
MGKRPKIALVWSVVAIASLTILLASAPLFGRAGRCVADYNEGERTEARVASLNDAGATMKALGADSRSCLVGGSDLPPNVAVGDEMVVVFRPGRPGSCTTADTLEAANAVLTAVGATLVALVLGLILVGRAVQRTLTETPKRTTHLDGLAGTASSGAQAEVPCPRCAKPMEDGYLPLSAGIHWRGTDEPIGIAPAFGGLPGTGGWPLRARLHGLRCDACELVIFRYGKARAG